MESEDGIRMGGTAVKKLAAFLCGGHGGISLSCCDAAKGWEQGVVDATAAAKETAHDFLTACQLGILKCF